MKIFNLYLDENFPKGTTHSCLKVANYLVQEKPIIHTTQACICSTDLLEKGYRIFVHMKDYWNKFEEIKYGKNEWTDREIRLSHNLEKLILAELMPFMAKGDFIADTQSECEQIAFDDFK